MKKHLLILSILCLALGATGQVLNPGPKPISQLPNASLPLLGGELLPIVQNGITKKVTASGLVDTTKVVTAKRLADSAISIRSLISSIPTPTLQSVTSSGATTIRNVTIGDSLVINPQSPGPYETRFSISSRNGGRIRNGDLVYEMPFLSGRLALTSQIQPTPSLDLVSTINPATSQNLQVGGYFSIKDPGSPAEIAIDATANTISHTGPGGAPINNTLPNSPGTFALLSDIPAPTGGTVTSVSVTSANGISGTVATGTTTPAITLSLGAITPAKVNGITLSGSATPALSVTGTASISGTNTGDQTNITGNAGTVTNGVYLATAQVLTNKDLTSGTNTFPTFNQNTTGNAATVTNGVYLTTAQTLTNKTLTSPVITSPTGIVKADVGLSNVPNVDATNAANITTGTLAAGRYGATTIPVTAVNATGTPSSTTYLRGDGSWATVASGGGGTPGGSSGQIQYNSSGAFTGAAKASIQAEGNIAEASTAFEGTNTAPSTGATISAVQIGSNVMLASKAAGDVVPTTYQGALGMKRWGLISVGGSGTAATAGGMLTSVAATTGSLTAGSSGAPYVYGKKASIYYTTNTANTAVGQYSTTSDMRRGTAQFDGGFNVVLKFALPGFYAGHRLFVGVGASGALPCVTSPTANPSTLTQLFGIGMDDADANLQLMTNDNTGTATKTDLGFAPNNTSVYELHINCKPASSSMSLTLYEFTVTSVNKLVDVTVSADLPTTSTNLATAILANKAAAAPTLILYFFSAYAETDL